MNKTITKVFLSLSICLCYTAGNVSNIHAASLNTSGVKTEYEMLELQRNKGNSGSSNILSNGDFEQGSKKWTIKNDAVITNEKDGNENKGFTHSQYYGVVKGADSTLSQKITVSSNKNYAAQARVKIGHAGESVRFVVYDDSNTLFKESVVGYDESLKGTYQTVNININSENYTQLNVALIGVNGDVCVDNVIFTPFTSKGIMDPGVVEDGDFINRSNRWKTTGDGKIQKHEGNDSGYLLSWSGNASVYQEVSLKPNTEYTLKADVLIAKAGAYGFLAVKTPNVENLNPAVEKTVKCTKDQEWTWQQVELKFNSRNNTSVSVCFLKWLDNADRNQNNATFMSQMIVDNVELVEGKSEVQEVEDENYTVLWADESTSNDEARTRVDCLVRTNDPKEIAKLPAGEYNLHISAMHKSKPSVRKTVKLTIVASADYTKLTKAVNKANALDKSLYKDFSKVEDALDNVKYDLDITKQSEVNAMTKTLEDAMAGLEYKDADYTKLNEAVNKAKSLDKTLYVDFSAVEDALDNVKYDLDITKQSEVNAMTKTLEDAMAGLEYKDADYTKLNEAVNKAKSLDKTLYVDFSAVESALNNVKYDLDITKQSEVDAMTKALEDAVAKLEKKITIDTTDKTDPKPSDKNDQKPSDKSDSKTDTTVKTGDTTNVLPMFVSVIVTLLGIFLLKRKKA